MVEKLRDVPEVLCEGWRVWRVKRNGDRTNPCSAPDNSVRHTVLQADVMETACEMVHDLEEPKVPLASVQ